MCGGVALPSDPRPSSAGLAPLAPSDPGRLQTVVPRGTWAGFLDPSTPAHCPGGVRPLRAGPAMLRFPTHPHPHPRGTSMHNQVWGPGLHSPCRPAGSAHGGFRGKWESHSALARFPACSSIQSFPCRLLGRTRTPLGTFPDPLNPCGQRLKAPCLNPSPSGQAG